MADFFATLVLLGIVQGAVLAGVLASRRANRLANRILAVLIACVALMMALGEVSRRWGFSGHPHLLGLGAPLPFLFGPLIYLYVTTLTRPVERFDPRWLVHGVPFVTYLLFMMQVFFLLPAEEKVPLALAADSGRGLAATYAVGVLQVAQALTYLLLAWRALARYGEKMTGYFSDLARIDLRWLRALVATHMAIWGLVLVNTLFRGFGASVQIASSLAIFVTGYVSLWQPELAQKAAAARVVPTVAPKYQRNRIDEDEAGELLGKLDALMTVDHLYKDPALTLPLLAERLGVPPHTLSQLLNVRVGKNFFVFVNGHRVEALKAKLLDPAEAKRGVLELAFEVGFSSKSTANSFFKKLTGTTPSAFRKTRNDVESRS